MSIHNRMAGLAIHEAWTWKVANQIERLEINLNDEPVSERIFFNDRMCLQLDDGSVWRLSDYTTMTWLPIGTVDVGYTPEDSTNKVSTWQVTPDDIKYPTEKLVKDSLDNKVDVVEGKGLSTNDFTDDLESKLNGIEAGAEVNVQPDWNATEGDGFINNKPTIPDELSDLSEDIDHRTVSDIEKGVWNGKQDALNFVQETNNQYLRDDNTFQSIETAVGGYANNLYFDDTPSDIPNYETLTYNPSLIEIEHLHDIQESDGTVILHNYIYPTAVTVDLFPAGLWSFTFWGRVSSSVGITQLGITYFRRLVDNSEVDLFTIWSSDINNTTNDWIKFEMTQSAFTLATTDRMGARILLKTTRPAIVSVYYVIGDGRGAFLNNPNKIRHSQLRAFNGDLTVQHLDSTTEKALPIDADSVGIWDSVAVKFVRTSLTNFKSFLKTYFDGIYASIGSLLSKKVYHGIESNGTISVITSGDGSPETPYAHSVSVSSYVVWIQGVKYESVVPVSVDLAISLGVPVVANKLYYIYFGSNGSLTVGTSMNLKAFAPLCMVYTNNDISKVALTIENHNHTRNLDWHTNAHKTIGTRYFSGLGLTAPTTLLDDSLDISTGVIYDEDIAHTITNPTTSRIWYQVSAGSYTWVDSSLPYAGVINDPQWLDTDDYTLKSVADNRFVCYWLYATNDRDRPIYIVPTQASTDYVTITTARNEQPPVLSGLASDLAPEWKLIHRLIYRGDGEFQESADYRTVSSLPAGSIAPTSHNTLSDRSFIDSHPASAITNTPSGNIVATDVQSAINEIDTEITSLLGFSEIFTPDEFLDGSVPPDGYELLINTKKAVVRKFSGTVAQDVDIPWCPIYKIATNLVQFRVIMFIDNATVPTTGQTIIWKLSGTAYAESDNLNKALGTAVSVTYTAPASGLAQYDRISTGWSGDVTITDLATLLNANLNLQRDTTSDTYEQKISCAFLEIKYNNGV